MRHSQSEILKAYADNKELIIILNREDNWTQTNPRALFDYEGSEYFLCLPKHKETCLHWLNGGWVQILHSPRHDWATLDSYESDSRWLSDSDFMHSECRIRIKPKKEKRFVVINNGSPINELFKIDEDIRNRSGGLDMKNKKVKYVMGDVFELPLKLAVNELAIIDKFDCVVGWADAFSGEAARDHFVHAVNDHDRLTEENQRLRDALVLISLNSSFSTMMPHESEVVEKLLEQCKQDHINQSN